MFDEQNNSNTNQHENVPPLDNTSIDFTNSSSVTSIFSASRSNSSSSSSSSSSSDSEFEFELHSDSDSDSESEPKIKGSVSIEKSTIEKKKSIELSFSAPGFLILMLFCIGHESMYGMIKMFVVEFIDKFKLDDDLAHVFFAIAGLFMLRLSGGIWFWSTYTCKEYKLFKNSMKVRIRRSKEDNMVGKLLQYDLKTLKWFRRHKKLQGIWNIIGFNLCEISAIYLLEDHIAMTTISIPKRALFNSMPSAQTELDSCKVSLDTISPFGEHSYRIKYPIDKQYDMILKGENPSNIVAFPTNSNSTLILGTSSTKSPFINNQLFSQEKGSSQAVNGPQVTMTNKKNDRDLDNWFKDLHKKDKKYLDDILTEESFDALFGDEQQVMFKRKSKCAFYFLCITFISCVLKKFHFDMFDNETF